MLAPKTKSYKKGIKTFENIFQRAGSIVLGLLGIFLLYSAFIEKSVGYAIVSLIPFIGCYFLWRKEK
jgi:succinate dehydrogenase hydrophobic anchor subunit